MKYNTFDTYKMSAEYKPFTLVERQAESGILYREYQEAEDIACKVVLNVVGQPLLFSKRPLMAFALVYGFKDVAGTPFLEDMVYSINKVSPVFDPGGFIYAYQHPLAQATSLLTTEPVNPPPEYEDIDQAGG